MSEDILNKAAQVAFYFSFALFPLLLFLVSLFGIIMGSAEALRSELFFYLRQIMPESAFELVRSTIREVTKGSSGGKLTIGILIAFWSASAGFDSIRVALNSIYKFEENRSWWMTKLLSLLFTLVISVLVFIALGTVMYGWKFFSLFFASVGLAIPGKIFLSIVQWIITLCVLLLIFGLIYNLAPARVSFKWIWVTPGAVTGIILWLLLSSAFRLYLQYFNTYNRMYGSLGAVIILLLWLYLTALVILIGGVINAILREMAKDDDVAATRQSDSNEDDPGNRNWDSQSDHQTPQEN